MFVLGELQAQRHNAHHMLEAFGLSYQMLVAGGLILGVALLLRWLLRSKIPQSEIDAEARALIVEHGAYAVGEAEAMVLRSQWSKGNSDTQERAARVLKAVRGQLG